MESAPHATQGILNLDISELLVGMGLDLFQELAFRRQHFPEGVFEIGLG